MSNIYQQGPDGIVQVVPREPSLADFLNNTPLEGNPAWTDYLEALDFIESNNAEQKIKKLQNVRMINSDTDESIVRLTCQLLGFDLSSDIYTLSAGGILKIATQLSAYSEHSSTPDFTKFFDFVLNSKTEVSYLWTKDYESFHPDPMGPTLLDGGEWYKTTHVTLSVELRSEQAIIDEVFKLRDGKSIASKIKDVFYEFAPLTLVIDSLLLAHPMPVSLGFKAQILKYRHDQLVVQ